MKLIKVDLVLIILLMAVVSCEKVNSITPTEEKVFSYLHISHTRTDANPNMVSNIEEINYEKFDMLLLGGDLATLTSINDETISHVDSVFNLGSPNTLWALGNHDYSNLDRVNKFTKRQAFYSIHKNGLTFIVLDTQDSLTNIVGLQRELFNSIVDTINESSHLILLHHKLFWMFGNQYLQPQIENVSNAPLGDCFYCINPNNFYSEIYPKLVEVKERGIEVICIGGDIGFKDKEFEYITDEGIYFLASGCKWTDSDNKALLLKHDLEKNKLQWEFKLLSELK